MSLPKKGNLHIYLHILLKHQFSKNYDYETKINLFLQNEVKKNPPVKEGKLNKLYETYLNDI